MVIFLEVYFGLLTDAWVLGLFILILPSISVQNLSVVMR